MKRRIALSIALAVSVLSLALVRSDSTGRAQQRQRCTEDTGVITLGPNQALRLTLFGDSDGDRAISVRFRRIEYAQGACNGGVCKLGSVTDLILDPVTLRPGEAAFYTSSPLGGLLGVRLVALTNDRNVRATATIINTVTGEATSTSLLDTMEEEECGL